MVLQPNVVQVSSKAPSAVLAVVLPAAFVCVLSAVHCFPPLPCTHLGGKPWEGIFSVGVCVTEVQVQRIEFSVPVDMQARYTSQESNTKQGKWHRYWQPSASARWRCNTGASARRSLIWCVNAIVVTDEKQQACTFRLSPIWPAPPRQQVLM